MKSDILQILQCPHCSESLGLKVLASDGREIRRARLLCDGPDRHQFPVEDGIIRFAAGFNHEAVQREIAYENSTYSGSRRLVDPKIIAGFPETMVHLWPHDRHFGPDFRALIKNLNFAPDNWVLDVGTAACWTTRLLAEAGARPIALDINDAHYYGLKTADLLFAVHGVYFERVLESMTHLPFRNETIDYVIFNASFHHTPDMPATLRECYRVLKPGGRVAMINEAFASWRHRFLPGGGRLADLGSHHEIPYRDLESALRTTGFSVQYGLTHHVRQALRRKLAQGPGCLSARLLERFPVLLKQLNSAQVLLTKNR
jgi:SAM-dependent methyltransferase